ncbi:hypothetical protein LguiA_004128 [Lonicera macranthoides]
MALLRLPYFPPSSQISAQNLLFSSSSSLSYTTATLSPLSLPIKTLKPTLFLSPVSSSSSSIKSQSSITTPQLEKSNEIEEEEEDEASRTRLLAQNVPWTCTADEIRALFENYGTVLDVEFSMYNKSRNRGLVFVSMGSHEEAVAALANLESYEFEGRALKLSWAKPKKKKPSSSPMTPKPLPVHNLFVANLPFQARANDLKEFFNSENANVVSAEVIFRDNPRESAGYGFVSFKTKKEAEAALSAFQGKVFMGRTIRVEHSKRFLRQETKVQIESKNTSSESNPNGVQSDKPAEV